MVTEHQEKVYEAYFFLVNKLINQPVKPPISGAGSSQIPPLRLNSSKILFSFFAIMLHFLSCYITSCCILSVPVFQERSSIANFIFIIAVMIAITF